mgnify:CR=1 FL=1
MVESIVSFMANIVKSVIAGLLNIGITITLKDLLLIGFGMYLAVKLTKALRLQEL